MNEYLNEIKKCEICENSDLVSILNLGNHPMCDDLIPISSTKECKEYPIEILYCKNCLTAHQRYQVPKQELFPATYHYRSRFTADVLKGMGSLVDSVKRMYGDLAEKKVLDIGCNDGSLLDFFKDKGANTYGIEPTLAYLDAAEKNHVVFGEYLSIDTVQKFVKSYGKPEVITFTNVFAHIEHIDEVINCLRLLLHEKTIIVIENHYLGSVLDGNQFDTFYHEHPRTYSFTSFTFMASLLGLDILDVEFPSRYGGNIRITMGNSIFFKNLISSVKIDELKNRESNFFDQFIQMKSNIEKWRLTKLSLLESMNEKHGPLPAKAFPGRAAILIKLLGLNENHLSAVFEKHGSLKVGYFLPGTKIPIKSDTELKELKNSEIPILNLAWHITDEIKNYLSENNINNPVIDILSESDFG